jgi:hypothetical protein
MAHGNGRHAQPLHHLRAALSAENITYFDVQNFSTR